MGTAVLTLVLAIGMVGCRPGRPAFAPRSAWLTLSRASAPGSPDRGPWVAVAANGSVTAERWATTRRTTSLDEPALARLHALATAAANTDYLACRNAHAEYNYVLTVRGTVGPIRWVIAPGPGCLDDAPPHFGNSSWRSIEWAKGRRRSEWRQPNVRRSWQRRYGGGRSAAASYPMPLQLNFRR